MKMRIADVLELGFLIHSDDDLGFYFTWNGYSTFNVFYEMKPGEFDCADCFTSEDSCDSIYEAVRHCEGYVKRVMDELDELHEREEDYIQPEADIYGDNALEMEHA